MQITTKFSIGHKVVMKNSGQIGIVDLIQTSIGRDQHVSIIYRGHCPSDSWFHETEENLMFPKEWHEYKLQYALKYAVDADKRYAELLKEFNI
jgi:hypothetical protein